MKKIFLILIFLLSLSIGYSQNTTFDIFIPNAFTPDKDGVNDIFYPVVVGEKSVEVTIYNRMGVVMCQNYNEGWDGCYKNIPCQEAVYLYQIIVIDCLNEKHTYYGTITLLKFK